MYVCLSVCSRYKRKTARAISIKVGRHIVDGRTSACTDLEIKRSKVKVTGYQVHPASVRISIRLPMFSSF